MIQGAPLQCCCPSKVPDAISRRTVDGLMDNTSAASFKVASPRSSLYSFRRRSFARRATLTPVWVPDTDHEAMRDLIRLRSLVRQIATRARQHLQGFLLRHGRKHGRGTAWRMAYRRWLSTLAFDHPAQQIAFQDYVDAVMDAERRLKRIEEQIFGLLPEWTLRPVVDALQAMRGIALINAVVLVAEVGDFTRFSNPRQLMAYFGMVPGERSSGETVRRGAITKTGNTHVRRALVEGAWAYRMKAHRPS